MNYKHRLLALSMEGLFFSVGTNHHFFFMQCETKWFCFKSLIFDPHLVLYSKCLLMTVKVFFVFSFPMLSCCLLDAIFSNCLPECYFTILPLGIM